MDLTLMLMAIILLLRMEESIYNIIPKQYIPESKGPRYKSKYPHNIPPTGSTFAHHTTSKPGITNLSGQFQLGLQAHTQYGNQSTMGYLKHDRKPSPDKYRKKHTGTMGSNVLPPLRNFSYDCAFKKPDVPKHNEKPILGLKSNKDFVVSNAIQNILSSARKQESPKDWLKKEYYGKVPNYLEKIKDSIDQEYRMIQTLHQRNQQNKQILSQEEIQTIRDGLKQKWSEVNREYQRMTHVRLIDTTGLKRRKENYEKQLQQIETDIKRLNKAYIFVQ